MLLSIGRRIKRRFKDPLNIGQNGVNISQSETEFECVVPLKDSLEKRSTSSLSFFSGVLSRKARECVPKINLQFLLISRRMRHGERSPNLCRRSLVLFRSFVGFEETSRCKTGHRPVRLPIRRLGCSKRE